MKLAMKTNNPTSWLAKNQAPSNPTNWLATG
jgi:hypothetical protein